MKSYIILFVFTFILLAACSDDDGPTNGDENNKTYTTQEQDIANGSGYTFLTVNSDDKPVEFGIVLKKSVLEDLPEQKERYRYHLEAPTANGENILGITTVHVDWNPNGHPPQGIYTVPHFDLHFFVIPESTINNISQETVAPVPNKYIPEHYKLINPTYIPKMGAHAADTTSREFQGEEFTRTFIYGYYDKKMAFFEPMVTRQYLSSLSGSKTGDFPAPDNFSYSGYAPQSVSYTYDSENEEYRISLSDLKAVTSE